MSQPPPYTPVHSFSSDSATLANFPGQALDVEFNAVKSATDAIDANLKLIQRDDGALANGIVSYDQLSANLQTAGLQPALPWLTGTTYQVGNNVINGTTLYRCLVIHTSGTFATDLAAGKWILIVTLIAGTNGTNGAAGTNGTNGTNGSNGVNGATGAGYSGTSTTSLLIANSVTKTFTTQTGLAYLVGDYVRAKSAANGNNYMEGLVSSYSGTSLAIAVTAIGGSGTFADWNFNQSGAPGAPSGVTTLNGSGGALVMMTQPQGRLTLVSGVPVMTTSQSSISSMIYAIYGGNQCVIYDGTNFTPTTFTELSNVNANSAVGNAGPAAVAASSMYDYFVWNNGGTVTLTRGPAWTNDTTRSAGTALVRVNGIWLNNASITNGPAASRGTYVGTARSDGSSNFNYIFGSTGAGGVAGNFGVWNAYNRVNVCSSVHDNTSSWTYAVAATWRAANGSATARVSFVCGLSEEGVSANYNVLGTAGTSSNLAGGIGLNVTNAFSGSTGYSNNAGIAVSCAAYYSGVPPIGYNFVSAIEYNSNTTAGTWNGSAAVNQQIGLHFNGRM